MDGLQLLSELKDLRPDTPIVLITGHGDHDLAVQALRGGAFDYVTKPIDRDYFVGSLRRAMQCSALAREVTKKKQELEQHARELEDCVREQTTELTVLLHSERVARADLEEAREALQQAQEEREEFVSMIAHELGGPLTTVRGYAELLGRTHTPPATLERARALIVSETSRMARLVEDLADSARLATRSFELHVRQCDLVEIVREQVELAEARTTEQAVELNAPPELPGEWDRDRLGQVLSNLLSNALTYSAAGPIEVDVWREADQARIRVRDHGPGIPPDHFELVFRPGERLGNGRASAGATGAGLGLSISRSIVEAHGGRIWLESIDDDGAAFNVALPLASAPI
jgi:signal transduction histidine kinase